MDCALQMLRVFWVFVFVGLFLQMEGLGQPRVRQVCRGHFSKSNCSVCVSGSHFGPSRRISNIFARILFAMLTCDQGSFPLLLQQDMARGRLTREGKQLLAVKSFLNKDMCVVFLDTVRTYCIAQKTTQYSVMACMEKKKN